nr:MAG: hypothetical protein DIU78_02900 [Pseudomonadota bacterium]
MFSSYTFADVCTRKRSSPDGPGFPLTSNSTPANCEASSSQSNQIPKPEYVPISPEIVHTPFATMDMGIGSEPEVG